MCPTIPEKHDEENTKDGSGQSGINIHVIFSINISKNVILKLILKLKITLQDDTEDEDATEEDLDDDIRIVDVEPTTSRSNRTPITEIVPATTPRAEFGTSTTVTETPVTYRPATTPTTVGTLNIDIITTTSTPIQTTSELSIYANSTENDPIDYTTTVTSTTTDGKLMQVTIIGQVLDCCSM